MKSWLLLVMFLVCLSSSLAAPSIIFSPGDGTLTTNRSLNMTANVTESSLQNISLTLNGSMMYPYDASLMVITNFDNLSGLGDNATLATDASANSRNATLNNTEYGAGAYYGGLVLNGVNASARYGDIMDLDNTNLTISLWFKTNSTGTGRIVSKRAAATGTEAGYDVLLANGALRTYVGNGSVGSDTSSIGSGYNDNRWHNIVYIIDRTNGLKQLYVDSILKSNVTFSITNGINNTQRFCIGATGVCASSFFNGTLDELRVYNRTFSAGEIINAYTFNIRKYNASSYQLWYYPQNNLINYNYTSTVSACNSSGGCTTSTGNVLVYSEDYYFNYSGADFTLTYRVTPQYYAYDMLTPASRETTFGNGIWANLTYAGTNYFFRPTLASFRIDMNGTTYNYTNNNASVGITLSSFAILGNNSTSVTAQYNFTDGNNYATTVNVTYALDNGRLRVSMSSATGDFIGYDLVSSGGDGYKDTPFNIYFNIVGGYFLNLVKKDKIFYNIYYDFRTSQANSISFDKPSASGNKSTFNHKVTYTPDLSGHRRTLNETIYIAAASDFDNIYPQLAWRTAPRKNDWQNSTVFSFVSTPSNFSDFPTYFQRWHTYGYKNVVYWFRSVGEGPHPTFIPIAASKGGSSALIAAIQNMTAYGQRAIFYQEYQDIYNASVYFNTSRIVQNATGALQTAFGTSYAARMDYQWEVMTAQASTLHSYGTTGVYYDVSSGVSPCSYVDYNQTQAFNYTRYNATCLYNILWSKDITDYLRNIEGGPVMSENARVSFYMGIPDYVYGDTTRDINYVPNYEIKGVQPYTQTMSPLWGDVTQFNTPPTLASIRSFVTSTLVNREVGLANRLDTQNWSDYMLGTFYFLTNAPQRDQQASNISVINFWNGTSWITVSDLFRNDDTSWNQSKNPIVYERYENGFEGYFNKNISGINVSYKGVTYTLLPNMTIAWNNQTRLFLFTGAISGTNVSIVEANVYVYLDANSTYNHSFVQNAGDYYIDTVVNYNNQTRPYTTAPRKITSINFTGQHLLYRLGNSYTIKVNDSDPYTRLFNNESIELDDQLPISISGSGNTRTIASEFTEEINATIIINTAGITPSSPRITYPNGTSENPSYSYDSIGGVVSFSSVSLPPGTSTLESSTTCGDGFVTGVEACDLGSGNGVCPNTCTAACQYDTTLCAQEYNANAALGLINFVKWFGTIMLVLALAIFFGVVFGRVSVSVDDFNRAFLLLVFAMFVIITGIIIMLSVLGT